MSNYTHYALDAAENFGLGLEFCSKFKCKTFISPSHYPKSEYFYFHFFFPQNALMVFKILYYKAPTFVWLVFLFIRHVFPFNYQGC